LISTPPPPDLTPGTASARAWRASTPKESSNSRSITIKQRSRRSARHSVSVSRSTEPVSPGLCRLRKPRCRLTTVSAVKGSAKAYPSALGSEPAPLYREQQDHSWRQLPRRVRRPAPYSPRLRRSDHSNLDYSSPAHPTPRFPSLTRRPI